MLVFFDRELLFYGLLILLTALFLYFVTYKLVGYCITAKKKALREKLFKSNYNTYFLFFVMVYDFALLGMSLTLLVLFGDEAISVNEQLSTYLVFGVTNQFKTLYFFLIPLFYIQMWAMQIQPNQPVAKQYVKKVAVDVNIVVCKEYRILLMQALETTCKAMLWTYIVPAYGLAVGLPIGLYGMVVIGIVAFAIDLASQLFWNHWQFRLVIQTKKQKINCLVFLWLQLVYNTVFIAISVTHLAISFFWLLLITPLTYYFYCNAYAHYEKPLITNPQTMYYQRF